MHPLLKAAIACAGLSAIGLALRKPIAAPPASASAAAPAPSLVEMPCPPRHLPEGATCVPLLGKDDPLVGDPEVQRERRARGRSYEVIPRRPDRPEDPRSFRYPLAGPPLILRGFDDLATRPVDQSPVSVELSAERGTAVLALSLPGQRGRTRVAATGRHVGNTVVSRHDVDEADRTRTYLLVHGRLDAPGPDAKAGAELDDGATLGFAGDSGSPGVVRLYLEARRVREDSVIDGMDLAKLVDASVSVPVDLRNVLPPAPPAAAVP